MSPDKFCRLASATEAPAQKALEFSSQKNHLTCDFLSRLEVSNDDS